VAVAVGISGVLSLVALLGFRHLRREHAVMAAWLLSTLVIIHLPLRFQRRMIGGIQFPLAVLATAAIACVLPVLCRRLVVLARRRAAHPFPPPAGAFGWGTLVAVIVISPLQFTTPYYLQDIEWTELMAMRYPAWLQTEQRQALAALERLEPPESTVLASYEIGNYVPPLTGHRCVIGHYALTVNALQKKADTARFFAAGEADDPWRLEFLRRWSVRWVLVTSIERELGGFDPETRPWLEEVFAAGTDPERRAVIYAVRLEAADRSPSSIPSP
jgi:hypothetical protein